MHLTTTIRHSAIHRSMEQERKACASFLSCMCTKLSGFEAADLYLIELGLFSTYMQSTGIAFAGTCSSSASKAKAEH